MAAKYKIIAQLLKEEFLSKRNSEDFRLPTEKDLCLRFGVSRETVRHALSELLNEGLIRSRQGSGYYIPANKSAASRQIAVIVTFEDEYIFPTVLHDMQSVLDRYGYKIQVYSTLNRISAEREILQSLLMHPVGGILAEGSKTALPNPNEDLYIELKNQGTPIVFFQGISRGLQSSIPFVIDDNYNGGYNLASYLIGKGYKKLGGIFKSDDIQGLERYSGMMHAIRDCGLPLPDKSICWFDTNQRSHMIDEKSGKMLNDFLEDRLNRCDAVICYNDEISYHLIKLMRSMGKSIPEDIAIVSFDNSYFSRISPVPITSMWHNKQRMGLEASSLLLELIQGKPVKSKILPWELITRNSG